MAYQAKQGDIIWITQVGHEQMGRRPAIVVSNDSFNRFSARAAMVCPITNTNKGIPVQLALDSRTKTTGVIMCDQAKILDLQSRNPKFIERAPSDILYEVVDIIRALTEIEQIEN